MRTIIGVCSRGRWWCCWLASGVSDRRVRRGDRRPLRRLFGLFWDGSVDIGNHERRSRHPVVMGARTFVFCSHNFCPAVFLACDLTGQGLKNGNHREDRRSLRSLHEALATIPNIRCDAHDLGVSYDMTAAVLSCPRSFTCYRFVCSVDLDCLTRLGAGHSRSTICELALQYIQDGTERPRPPRRGRLPQFGRPPPISCCQRLMTPRGNSRSSSPTRRQASGHILSKA
jgi:hypothetical protein